MGSCFSCTREEAPAPAPTVAPGKTSCQKAQWEESKWRDDTKAIWGRCLGDLPVHMDLPRLANRMRIVNRHGKEVSEVAGDSSRMEIVRAHLRYVLALRVLLGMRVLLNVRALPQGGAQAVMFRQCWLRASVVTPCLLCLRAGNVVHLQCSVLATELGEDDMIQAIETKFYEYAREDGGGDFSQQVRTVRCHTKRKSHSMHTLSTRYARQFIIPGCAVLTL